MAVEINDFPHSYKLETRPLSNWCYLPFSLFSSYIPF